MSARVGVVFSGCGFLDGSEIHEAVSILIALDRRGAQVICMAPNQPQAETINHLTQKPDPHPRNMLEESARIARGKIRDIAKVQAKDIDALIFPGGYGAAKNLCNFAVKGPDCTVHPEVERLVRQVHQQRKPIGLACIAPVMAARIMGQEVHRPRLTIGTDRETASALEKMGAEHHNTNPTDICIDDKNRLVTTPCYMNDVGPWVVFEGAERMVEEVLRMTGDPASLIREQLGTLPG